MLAEKECRRDRSTAWGQPEKAIRYTYNEKTEEWDMRRVYIVRPHTYIHTNIHTHIYIYVYVWTSAF